MKTEKEKMLSGEIYDAGDTELITRWHLAKKLMKEYNATDSTDRNSLNKILKELLGSMGESVWISAPFYVDYGENIHIGNDCEINMSCTFFDCNAITIGDNTTIGAGSVVTKNIPANCLTIGNPSKVIRYFD